MMDSGINWKDLEYLERVRLLVQNIDEKLAKKSTLRRVRSLVIHSGCSHSLNTLFHFQTTLTQNEGQ